MKKVLFLLLAALPFMGVSASNVSKIEYANAGDFSLGIMIGVPPHSHANMPSLSVDGMWGLADGFIHTKTFGDNGAIDLGAYIGYCHWGDSYTTLGLEYDHTYWELPLAVRCGFHFEFVQHLDVYAGFQGGVAICHWRNEYANGQSESDGNSDGIFGNYLGAKWHFTDSFGVKAEFSSDWIGKGEEHNNMPPFAVGVTFNF